jgi:hypothetical protein
MTDTPGIATPLPTPPVIPASAVAPGIELLAQQLALQEAANFVATVIGRSAEGAVLLRSAFGTFSLKSALPLGTGTKVDVRYQPGNPPSLTILGVAEGEPAEPAAPPTRLDLGTTTGATVIASGSDSTTALPVGTRLVLRVVPTATPGAATAAPPPSGPSPATTAPPVIAGQILLGAGGETIVETPVGTLALDLRMALPPGTTLAFERLRDIPATPHPEPSPSLASGWPTLDQVLTVLDQAAPNLAQQVRAMLTPETPAAFTGTLLFLIGALYRGNWPGEPVHRALSAVGEQHLQQRLAADVTELARLSADKTTDPWRVLVLPLMSGTMVAPIRLYLRRRSSDSQDGAGDDLRFVFEAELRRLGTLQLDGRLRGSRLDLVLRSHASLPPETRHAAGELFRRASAANGLHGDIVFATAAEFAVAPLAAMRYRVEMQA